MSTAQAQVKVTFAGLEGDRHAGLTHKSDSRTPYYRRGTEIRNVRQVSLISVEELQEIARRMDLPALEPEWLGANLLIQGIPDLTMIPPSSRLYFPDDTVLVIDSENNPCIHPGKVIQSHFPERCRPGRIIRQIRQTPPRPGGLGGNDPGRSARGISFD